MLIPRAAKISIDEFAASFFRVIPPTGWGQKIAVAYSGGVDSTCLLFLMNKLLQEKRHSHPSLRELSLFAVHIDHGFRSTSQQNAKHCEQWAASRFIPHITRRIPWSTKPFPPLPSPGEKLEEIARAARYRALFDVLKEEGINVVLMAHHMDDQIETALMRYKRIEHCDFDLSSVGLAAMRGCRRWGMGKPPDDGLQMHGYKGMSRWVCRPLLEFSKARLEATVEDNNLSFVEDESNKDVNLTDRNAIRAALAEPNHLLRLPRPNNPFRQNLSEPTNPSDRRQSLVNTVREYGFFRDDIDRAVDEFLLKYTDPSPIGTYHIITSEAPPPARIVQIGIILRILRHVSPFPWGSTLAEARRSSEKLGRIADHLWPPYLPEQNSTASAAAAIRMSFLTSRPKLSGGGSVLWQPTPCSGVPTRKKYGPKDPHGLKKTFGWVAQRQPATFARPTEVDITERLLSREPFEYLWDMRWLMKFPQNAIDLFRPLDPHSSMAKAKSIQSTDVETGTGMEDFQYLIAPINNWWQPGIIQRFLTPGNPPFVEKSVYSYTDSLYNQQEDRHISMEFVRVIDAI